MNIDLESRFEDIDTLMRTCFPIHEVNSMFECFVGDSY